MRNNDHLTAQGAIFARLDKRTRRRVMCGKLNSSGEQTCEGEFGVIEENDDIGHDDGELNRRLWLGGIFVYNVDKNGWHPSRHAVARIRDAQREYYQGAHHLERIYSAQPTEVSTRPHIAPPMGIRRHANSRSHRGLLIAVLGNMSHLPHSQHTSSNRTRHQRSQPAA